MIWIVEAAIDLVASMVTEEAIDRKMRRRRRRRGEPEPAERTLKETKKEMLWSTGLAILLCAGLAATNSWSPWFSGSLVAAGLATFIVGLVVRRRMS
jgi:heme O synthase-like polyprenyltransferase